ncbi:MAG: cytochrome c biogenesis protein CcsA [Bacteriovoracaceae bacterium]|nr:cytochrome c biogenesis protein CcsA [Bacteriovoracaceae bacterium]
MRKYLIALLFISQAYAQTLCPPDLDTMPVRAGGRVKPMLVLADETLRFVTGSSKYGDESATMTFCKLSYDGLGIASNIDLPVKVEHVEAKALLGMKPDDTSIPFSLLSQKTEDIRMAHMKIKENNSYKKELNKIMNRVQIVQNTINGQIWTLPEVIGSKVTWVPLAEFLTEQKMAALKAQHADPFSALYQTAKADFIKAENDHFMREYFYQKAQFFLWGLLLGIIALAVAFAVPKDWIAITLTSALILLEVSGMVLRVLISGRAPITNMYETVMFSGFGALVISFILFLIKRERLFLIGGLAYNVLCLMMMKFANGMLDPSISPLVPVLRDNFWLSTHVTTVILSYAALALSWILANVVLARQVFKGSTPAQTRFQMEQIYTCIKVGVVLLSAGVILGGVWADYSWGRFWGWDPKETWSLIVLLVYMAILHGRYTNWITPARFVPLAAGAFMSVMMAWFGVNYILATGLHSYGFSEGGALFLGSFFLIQSAFLIFVVLKNKKTPA